MAFFSCNALALLFLTHGHLRVELVERLSDIRVKDDMTSESRNAERDISRARELESPSARERERGIDDTRTRVQEGNPSNRLQTDLCRAERSDLVCSRFSLVGCNCSFHSGLAQFKGSGEPLKVYVVVHERADQNIKHMYNPAMATITDALLASNVPVYVNLRTIPSVESNMPGSSTSKKSNLTTASLLAELDTGSVLIWVGGVGNKQVDWKSLKKDGIYGIYYQTEPGCGPQDVDEVWDYTWANIDLCPKSATTRRYIPPGLVLLHGPTHEDSRADRQAGFLGSTQRNCFNKLLKQVQINAQSAWTEASIRSAVSAHPIQLNIHKTCPGGGLTYNENYTIQSPFEAFRASQVFGSYGVLVSERCYAKDEKSFAGIVEFVDLKDIPKRANELMNITFTEFSKFRLEKHTRYKERFEPFKLFSEAGVYDLLAKLQREMSNNPSSAKAQKVNASHHDIHSGSLSDP